MNEAEGSHVLRRKPKGPKPQREAEEVKTKRNQNIKEKLKDEYLIPKHNLQTHPYLLFYFIFLSTKQLNK